MESELTGLKLSIDDGDQKDDGQTVPGMDYFDEYTDDTGLTMWANIGVLTSIAFGLKLLGLVGLWLMQRLDRL